ncbi:ATP-binding protein [Crassaminicella profunda]|uniref:ATP-binding protein n=1 Tax=Crassaminicella profunda TaxID=1286698 RepID=UPI001CA773E9|nr:ATP-binding protein [Crassaminicella profunda]QZY56485.1 ATP-binding protein [Crassaminicella profunda]
MPQLFFRTNAKVENLVGRELITKNSIAIFELVKNSYDAGATEVEIKLVNFLKDDNKNKIISTKHSYIEVIDNGKGMSTKEVEKYWMELGTPSKEIEKVEKVRLRSEQVETMVERTVNGEKGIGRFGVDKIGSYLILETIDKNLINKTIVYFDWNKFDDRSKLIHQIPCEYKVLPVEIGEHSGLKLTIKNLRDKWTIRDIDNLKRDLKKFLSPISIEQDEFRIILTYATEIDEEIVEESEEIINDSFDYLKTSIYADLNTNGLLYYEIEDKGEIVENKEIKLYSKSTFGAVTAKIYYLNTTDKKIFTKKMGLRTSDYGNIKIFKDNFRVMPYGEPHNDWLAIDKIHAQGFFRTFGTRDLVGYLVLSHDPTKKNYALKEATDRVGLIEDVPEFEDLKEFVWNLIKILQEYIFNRFKRQAKETTAVLKNESKDLKMETRDLFSSFKDIINKTNISDIERNNILKQVEDNSSEVMKKIETVEIASKEIEKKMKIYEQITNKEGLLFEVLHEIKNKLTVIDAQIKKFKLEVRKAGLNIDMNDLNIAFESIGELVTGTLNDVNVSKLQKSVFDIEEIIIEDLESRTAILQNKSIDVTKIFEAKNTNIKCSKQAIKSVLGNLLDNSIKALENIKNKKITIHTKINKGYVEVYFSDNGTGIEESKIPFIFSLWSSHTSLGGTGMGLASAKNIIEDHGGEIVYVDLFEENKKTTFLIKLPVIYS